MSNATEFIKLFNEAKKLIDSGVGVMPVRMSAEIINGKEYAEKSPLFSFKRRPEKVFDKDFIFKMMNLCTVDLGIAIVTGDKMEVIDIDEKYHHGISKEYLDIIKEVYPNIYKKLRIETTLNNGVHIPYFLDKSTEGSLKLAERMATDEELKENPKQKTFCFIETRGKDSTCIIPPTAGYSIISEVKDFPILSADERNILINVAKSFNLIERSIVKVKASKKGLRNYSTNPWEDYDSSDHIFSIIKNKGWSDERNAHTSNHIYFTRPGKKSGISASFVKDKRVFWIFSPNFNGLEPDRGYSPSSLLCNLNFNGDTKECFRWLVENGYGNLDENYELKVIERAIVNNSPLPKNLSKKGLKIYNEKKDDFESKFPHGIFWEQSTNKDGEVEFKINRQLILDVSSKMNFRLLLGDLVFLDGNVVEKVENKFFFEHLKGYIKDDNENYLIKILDKYENYLQQSGKFLISRLEELDPNDILKDKRNVCYKLFENCIVKITKDSIEELSYDEVDKFVMKDRIIDFNFKKHEETGLFVDFVSKAILPNPHLKSYIGYALHEYRDSSAAYFLHSIETVPNPKQGGGSGKNLFSTLIGMSTSYTDVNGEQIKTDSTFFQQWNGEKLMSISDLPKNFKFSKIKNMVSNSATVKKLYKDERSFNISELPKIWTNSNFSFDSSDGGVDRRLIYIEFSDFFTKKGGVDVYYGGKLFPTDWSENDWLGYYNYVVNSIQTYFKAPKLKNNELSISGWFKKFEINHGAMTLQFIEENIGYFCKIKSIDRPNFEAIYDKFNHENGVTTKYRKSSAKLNDALEEYCAHHNIEFIKDDMTIPHGGLSRSRCRTFISAKATDEEVKEDEGYDFDNGFDDDVPF